ncbi:MAG: thioredoxin domain-containing protein, partial [Deltaproteobacteria bacterium]
MRALVAVVLVAGVAGGCRPADERAAGPLPGAPPFEAALARRLARAARQRDAETKPRTRHLGPDGAPRYTNRLVLETSPYLLQHAHNPVDWHPWGDEAFATARREGRPVLLSIGYSTCHWCHVMEEESYEDLEIAEFLNAHFVAIKVDREERPDVDEVYLAAVQAMTGSGGWPLNVWLTPDRKPFYGGTYFPPRDGVRGARTGFLTVLRTLAEVYARDPARAAAAAADLAGRLGGGVERASDDVPDAASIRAAVATFATGFDATWGGFGRAPKFPRPSVLALLLRYYRRTGDTHALAMATATLERMAAG